MLSLEKREHLAWLTLNRPEKLNAMSPSFFPAFREKIMSLDQDQDVRVIVLKAEGKSFTAGLDLLEAEELLQMQGAQGREKLRQRILDLQDCFSVLEHINTPVLAAVHGHCIGAGVDLISACDIRLASQDAVFSIRETKLAIIVDLGTLQRLESIIGPGWFRELALTGRNFSAQEAEKMGLITHLKKDREGLFAKAKEIAQEIAANAPLTVQGVKDVIRFSKKYGTQAGLEYVAQKNAASLKSEDLNEAMAAFMEKRKPEFKGN